MTNWTHGVKSKGRPGPWPGHWTGCSCIPGGGGEAEDGATVGVLETATRPCPPARAREGERRRRGDGPQRRGQRGRGVSGAGGSGDGGRTYLRRRAEDVGVVLLEAAHSGQAT